MDEKTKLNEGDISQIAEFGHHPLQVFDKPHENFDYRNYENSNILTDIGLYEIKVIFQQIIRIERNNMYKNETSKRSKFHY